MIYTLRGYKNQTGREVVRLTEQISAGDVIRTRKPHPCGGDEWTVTRTGADIKIRCNTCGRVVMLDRDSFLRRRKAVLFRPAGPADEKQTEESQ